ncbi:endo-alpha-N-acetylgalactosaminidase family protein [Nonomuraea sp. NPDC059007]|uniref:endo-alpha-N-acetylgalactosaminidase family protein n=1 Tax=Nonomuraea sp. NPDC059007 TaxID=3346692 RepID=UPI00369D1888
MRRRSAALAGLLALATLTTTPAQATPAHPSAQTGAQRASETGGPQKLPPAASAASPEGAGAREPSPTDAPPDVRLPPTAPPTAPPTTSSPSEALSSPLVPSAAVADPVTISSRELSVSLDPAFPRVLGYTDRAGGATLGGSTTAPVVVLNGTPYPVTGTLTGTDGKTARYRLTFAALDGVALEASVGVRGRTTTFRIDKVSDTAAFRVGAIDLPGHDLVSVASDQAGAATAFTRLDPNSTRTADVFAKVTAQTAAEAQPVGATYGIVNTDRLAAAIESNSTYDRPSGPTDVDRARFWHQARKGADGVVRVGVWSGQWTYRAAGAPFTEELPWAKVVVTPDANGDGTLDWQDGAIAFRGIGVKARGAEQTKDRVAIHIPFNFASQATHPFLRTLDDVKRVALATDGLGQLAILKGYQSEGHDSAHPDYGGNYNKRAGGLKDLNTLLKTGRRWNADFGVHVNATEAYPVAKTFSETLVNKDAKGWNWLDQSYYIDQRTDLTTGDLARRFGQLREETGGDLALLYVDVYYSHGWTADRTLAELRRQGWQVSTEWSDKLERASLWSHWATDMSYGGATNKGLNSQIIRFIRNQEKDVWNAHPILGNARIEEFEGWTGEVDWNAFTRNIWEHNLPAKFLQHYPILDWNADEIVFGEGVTGTARNGRRELFLGNSKILDGTTYLLPWKGRSYHYNPAGGPTTWDADRPMRLYKLTDQGRVPAGTLTPSGGKITITAEPGVPYVLYPGKAPKQDTPEWGERSGVADPGFNDDTLRAWERTGQVSIEKNAKGQRVALLAAGRPAAIGQNLKGLTPGRTYSASAWIEVEPGKTRETTLEVGGQATRISGSTARNNVAADEKHGTYFQRVKVVFTATGNHAKLRLGAGGGDGAVRVDDVRLVTTVKPGPVEDFENVDQGWGPFVKGDAGGSTDPRTHIAQKHAPFTQAGWNGKTVDDVIGGEESLKVHEERQGLVYRTVPQTARFVNGHAYEVSFAYQNAQPGTYAWVSGYDKGGRSVETRRTPIPEQRSTTRFTERVVAGCGEVWVGLRSLRPEQAGADFILDDFAVKDLGPAQEPLACASLEVRPGTATLEPGVANDVTTVFTNLEDAPAGVGVTLAVPEGWQVGGQGTGTVQPGAALTTTWKVTPPPDAPYRAYDLRASAVYGGKRVEAAVTVRTLPPPPSGTAWASDHDWVSAGNGWGPAERDQSNGEQGEGDGRPLTIGGVAYAKGLGVHAPSTIRYYLGGRCTGFTAATGVDDAQPTRGSVRFTVLADGAVKAQSPVLRAADAAHELRADLTGARYVDLVVDDGGDGNGNDHGDWGGAQFTCG